MCDCVTPAIFEAINLKSTRCRLRQMEDSLRMTWLSRTGTSAEPFECVLQLRFNRDAADGDEADEERAANLCPFHASSLSRD